MDLCVRHFVALTVPLGGGVTHSSSRHSYTLWTDRTPELSLVLEALSFELELKLLRFPLDLKRISSFSICTVLYVRTSQLKEEISQTLVSYTVVFNV